MNTIYQARQFVLSAAFAAFMIIPASAQVRTSQDANVQSFINSVSNHLGSGGVMTDTSEPGPVGVQTTIVSFGELLEDIFEMEQIPSESLALSQVEWDSYGNRLEAALATDHLALNRAALRLIIAYGDNFNFSQEAVFDVMRIYRNDDSERARRMAVVALAEMNSDWALKFLERSSRFEKSETVKQTIVAVLAYRAHSQTSS